MTAQVHVAQRDPRPARRRRPLGLRVAVGMAGAIIGTVVVGACSDDDPQENQPSEEPDGSALATAGSGPDVTNYVPGAANAGGAPSGSGGNEEGTG